MAHFLPHFLPHISLLHLVFFKIKLERPTSMRLWILWLCCRIMQGLEPRMLQRLGNCDPLPRIKLKHSIHQINRILGRTSEHASKIWLGRLGQCLNIRPCLWCRDEIQLIIHRTSKRLDNKLQLIQIIPSGKDWLTQQHFCNHASHAPHINLGIICITRQEQLWSSIPPRHHIFCHEIIRLCLCTRQAKIGNLQIARRIQQDI
mmetsp:Transcript_12808/g.25665  ORF Transcript_12808/g.25665 Transcript_12808/m.25665 type:complete len:203 (+) Transcript_12808:49-657(+)